MFGATGRNRTFILAFTKRIEFSAEMAESAGFEPAKPSDLPASNGLESPISKTLLFLVPLEGIDPSSFPLPSRNRRTFTTRGTALPFELQWLEAGVGKDFNLRLPESDW